KLTEDGNACRVLDTISRDIFDMAVKMERENAMTRVADRAADAAEERLLDALLPGTGAAASGIGFQTGVAPSGEQRDTRQRFRKMLRERALDDREVEVEVQASAVGVEIM